MVSQNSESEDRHQNCIDLSVISMLTLLTRNITQIVFSAVLTAVLIWGWLQRGEYWFNAEQGLGYYFGITGVTLMALLLLYPLRKKARWMKGVFPIKYWFKAHMLFGILGPTLILFHCNFSLGSMNSNVALFSMLLVAFSGLVGRYIYRHTHNGLYGKKLDYDELQAQHSQFKQQLSASALLDDSLLHQVQEIEDLATNNSRSLIHSCSSVLRVNILSHRFLSKLRRLNGGSLQTTDGQQFIYTEISQHFAQELKTLRSMIGLSLYNRLFSIWHVVHLPFFFMMIITATIHIVVVHMY